MCSASYVSCKRGTASCAPCCGPLLLRRRPCSYRSIFLSAGPTAANPPHAAAAGKWDTVPLHRPWSAYYADSVNNELRISLTTGAAISSHFQIYLWCPVNVCESTIQRIECKWSAYEQRVLVYFVTWLLLPDRQAKSGGLCAIKRANVWIPGRFWHKIGWHGNVPSGIEKLTSDLSSTAIVLPSLKIGWRSVL